MANSTSLKMNGEVASDSVHMNGESALPGMDGPSASNGSVTESSTNNSMKVIHKQQVKKKKSMLVRGKSFCQEEACDQNNSDTSQESFQSNEGCVFPSPIAITEEEAMRETYCHYVRPQGLRQLLSNGGSFDEGSGDSRFTASNGNHSNEQNDAQGHTNYSNIRSAMRREAEKPPRLQKQSSRERIPSTHSRPGANGEGNTVSVNSVGNNSNGSSSEWLDSVGVDVHEFLVKTVQNNPRDRAILLQLEHHMCAFVDNKSVEFMKFPNMTSYHRMLVHRVARYFGMDHNIDVNGKAVIINRTRSTRKPEKKFTEYIAEAEDAVREEEMCRRSILKRMKNCQSLEHAQMPPMKPARDWKDQKQRSFEEREVDYEKVRARIFNTREAMGGGEKRSRDKERVMSTWRRKPWNSTDLESLPGRGHSTPPPSGSKFASLASKSNSCSGITVLSRRNNSNANDCTSISSSSSSSSIYPSAAADRTASEQVNGDYEQAPNPPGIYPYYPESSTSTVFDECASPAFGSQKCMHASPGHVVDLADKQLIVAVPSGFSVEPGTVLTHPHTGVPYVNNEGQPILYPGKPMQVQNYPQIPMHFNPKHGVPPHANAVPQGATPLSQPPYVTNAPAQSGIPSNGTPQNGQGASEAETGTYYPPTPQYSFPYQAAPVQLFYYPPVPNHHAPPDMASITSVPPTDGLPVDVSALHIDEKRRPENVINPSTQTSNAEDETEQVEHNSEDVASNLQTGETASNDAVEQSPIVSSTCVAEPPEADKSNSDDTVVANGNEQTRISNGTDMQPATHGAYPNGGGATFYMPREPQAPLPLLPGFTGQPLFTPPQTRIVSPHPHAVPMFPYPLNGAVTDRKMGPQVIAPQGTEQEYYIHQVPQHLQPGFSYMPSPTPPFYYMVNNQGFPQYQTSHNHVAPNMPVIYPSIPNGYAPHTLPNAPVYRIPYQYEVAPIPHTTASNDAVQPDKADTTVIATSGDEEYPLCVHGAASGIETPELISFAARHKAKLVQVAAAAEEAGEESPSDVYLLFPSSTAGFQALADSKPHDFRLSDVTSTGKRNELMSQIKAATM